MRPTEKQIEAGWSAAQNKGMRDERTGKERFLDGLSAALAVEAGAVGVKPLEWNPYRAETPFGWYEINDQRDVPESELKGRFPFLLCGSRLDYSRHASLQAAKAAAQADYEARIRSALTTSPASSGVEGEAVADVSSAAREYVHPRIHGDMRLSVEGCRLIAVEAFRKGAEFQRRRALSEGDRHD